VIANPQALEDLRASWDGVRQLRQKIYSAVMHGVIASPGLIFIADAAHNLPFLHACGVFNDVLEQLRDEGHFRCSKRELGALVRASRKVLPWRRMNYLLIRKEIVKCRNDLAHHAAIVPRDDCWRYIDAIEAELVHWGIVLPV